MFGCVSPACKGGDETGATPVVPQLRPLRQHSTIGVDRHRAVHLSANRKTGQTGGFDAGCAQDLAQRCDDASPPGSRTLLGPAVPGRLLLVSIACDGADSTFGRDHGDTDAAHPNVDGKQPGAFCGHWSSTRTLCRFSLLPGVDLEKTIQSAQRSTARKPRLQAFRQMAADVVCVVLGQILGNLIGDQFLGV